MRLTSWGNNGESFLRFRDGARPPAGFEPPLPIIPCDVQGLRDPWWGERHLTRSPAHPPIRIQKKQMRRNPRRIQGVSGDGSTTYPSDTEPIGGSHSRIRPGLATGSH